MYLFLLWYLQCLRFMPPPLLAKFASIVRVHLSRFFHCQNSLYLCFLYFSYFHFQEQFFFSFNCTPSPTHPPWPSLWDLFISSNFLFVFSWISLRNVLIFSLRTSIFFINLVLNSFPCASGVLEYSELATVGYLGSDGEILHWLLLIVLFTLASRQLGVRSWCWFLRMSLLDWYFVPWFVFLWSSSQYDLWLSRCYCSSWGLEHCDDERLGIGDMYG